LRAVLDAPAANDHRSAATAHAASFVAEKKLHAEEIGRDLAELTGDPEAFATALRTGLISLADPDYLDGQRRVAPGIGAVLGVRWPLIEAIKRGFREATRRERTGTWLFVADRLLREPELESQWFAFGLLERLIVGEPERTWQLVRRAAREAADWITVDSLAHVVSKGILAEPYRWAELEQLVYSPSRWERRLVGSTVATTPFVDRRRGREPAVAQHGLGLVGQLIGDAEPDVQKALAWALRSLTVIDRAAVTSFCESEAARAARTGDGHRAWVIRDVLAKLEDDKASVIRASLEGVRRKPGSASTSSAAEAADRFGQGMLGAPQPEPPLT
jgi:3-methyladenine DNA glycosylase AlkD